jgi:hypothetical protein
LVGIEVPKLPDDVDIFKAFKDHKIVDAFSTPGECDLTANVDFAYIKEALSDLGELRLGRPESRLNYIWQLASVHMAF